jgi:precorrin-6A/cobalt-precorrin-6A reductase
MLAVRIARESSMQGLVSLAGRTNNPLPHDLPLRIGGFGGVDGLVHYLKDATITHVIDATHPFAATISVNAQKACELLGLPFLTFTRRPWCAIPGDRWIEVQDASSAINALGVAPRRVFLGVGRQAAINFRDAPQHSYLLRVIDPPQDRELPLECEIIIGRGPFALEDELALLQEHKINVVVSKNSGGVIGYTKIIAARQLGLEVIMISPPKCNSSLVAYDYDTAMKFLAA